MTKINLEDEIKIPEVYKNIGGQAIIGNAHLKRQAKILLKEIKPIFEEVFLTGKYTLGPFLEKFEVDFAEYCSSNYCIGVSSGTSALHLSLQAIEIGPGDEVITCCNTYAATAYAISYTGATPVFVDIDKKTFNMSVETVLPKISKHTKAIIPVHMYGQPVQMDEIIQVAKNNDLYVIEDAAHSHGAEYKGVKTGNFGNLAAFSFFPGKNLGACGDGGAILTNDPILERKIRMLRYVGQRVKGIHEVIGFQERLDELQAAILSLKLKYLDEWNTIRRRYARMYSAGLKDIPIQTPYVCSNVTHVYYSYPILLNTEEQRNRLLKYLCEKGILAGVMYPILLPLQKAYHSLGYTRCDFPNGTDVVNRMINLPIQETMHEDEIDMIIGTILDYFKN